jgi:hypothetical protein
MIQIGQKLKIEQMTEPIKSVLNIHQSMSRSSGEDVLDGLNEHLNSSLLLLKITENLMKKTPKHIQGDSVTMTFHVKAHDTELIDQKSSSNHPYFIFDILDQQDTSYISEVFNNTLNPDWKVFQVKFRGTIQEVKAIKCRFIIWNWTDNSDHEQIGECDAFIRDLLETTALPLINRRKRKTVKDYKCSGTLIVKGSLAAKEEEIVNPTWHEMSTTVFQLNQQIKQLKKEIEEKEILKV